MRSQSGPAIYLCIQGEATIEAFEYLKTVFQEVKVLLNDKVNVTLDAENIPPGFVVIPIDLSYSMTYSELYVVQGPKNAAATDDDSHEDLLEAMGKEMAVESVFKVNRETLENEYNLVTLNLEKIKVINLKDVVTRGDRSIKQTDLQFITEGSHSLARPTR